MASKKGELESALELAGELAQIRSEREEKEVKTFAFVNSNSLFASTMRKKIMLPARWTVIDSHIFFTVFLLSPAVPNFVELFRFL